MSAEKRAYGLEILGTGLSGDLSRAHFDIVDLRILGNKDKEKKAYLDERDTKVSTLTDNLGQNTSETIENDSSLTSIN